MLMPANLMQDAQDAYNLTRSSLGPLPQINLTRQLVENPKSMCYQEMRPLLLQSREAKQPVHEPNLLRWLW